MCRTHHLIHDPNNSLYHHTSATLLLLVCDARSQKLHSHVFEMIELTVSIHNGNEGSSLKYLQYSGLMLENGSLHFIRDARLLDSHKLIRTTF